MSNEKMREEFCHWLLSEHGLESEWQADRNCFKDFPAHLAYLAWQASRADLVVELPDRDCEPCAYSLGFNACLSRSQRAIEAAGLKVKP